MAPLNTRMSFSRFKKMGCNFQTFLTASYCYTIEMIPIRTENTVRCDVSLTMAGLEVRASSLLIKASSCWMSAGGGSMRTGSRQDRVDSWTPWSGQDKASRSRDRSWTGTKILHINTDHYLGFTRFLTAVTAAVYSPLVVQ